MYGESHGGGSSGGKPKLELRPNFGQVFHTTKALNPSSGIAKKVLSYMCSKAAPRQDVFYREGIAIPKSRATDSDPHIFGKDYKVELKSSQCPLGLNIVDPSAVGRRSSES